ncbi:MAG: alpha/beta hydrolase [Acidobacteriota bacterium]|nr:alpha/beta hydrolase [Acidobacteriota bacterium]
MFYIDRGQGPALLLIHGMFGDHLDWEPILPPLVVRNRVIAVDLPGFGDSEKPDIVFTPEFFTRHLVALLDRLGIEKATVIGNSFGGQIAMSFALAHPDRVERLVLITTGGLHEYSAQEIDAALQRLSVANLMQFTPEIHAPLFGRLFFRPGTAMQRRYTEKQDSKLKRSDYAAYTNVLHRCVRLSLSLCLLDRVAELRMPALLVHGEKDPVVLVRWVRDAVKLFGDGTLVSLPECGHVPQLEEPEKVVWLIAGGTS